MQKQIIGIRRLNLSRKPRLYEEISGILRSLKNE